MIIHTIMPIRIGEVKGFPDRTHQASTTKPSRGCRHNVAFFATIPDGVQQILSPHCIRTNKSLISKHSTKGIKIVKQTKYLNMHDTSMWLKCV